MNTIDLNADLGEGAGTDTELIGIVSSASIACGGHAGDLVSMHACVRLAKARNVAIGAHPGFADPANFGRVRLDLPHDRIAFEVVAQVGRLLAVAAEEDAEVRYVKLHGALANMAAADETLAGEVFAAIRKLDASLAILAIDGSAQVEAARSLGLTVVREAYADRAYDGKARLVPRGQEGAVLTVRKVVLERCLRLARKGEIVSRNGETFKSAARSICIHGDTKGAILLARDIRDTLTKHRIRVASSFAE